MSCFKKLGLTVQLLPPPNPETDRLGCRWCGHQFDLDVHRRTCFRRCRHRPVWCLNCVDNLLGTWQGCPECVKWGNFWWRWNEVTGEGEEDELPEGMEEADLAPPPQRTANTGRIMGMPVLHLVDPTLIDIAEDEGVTVPPTLRKVEGIERTLQNVAIEVVELSSDDEEEEEGRELRSRSAPVPHALSTRSNKLPQTEPQCNGIVDLQRKLEEGQMIRARPFQCHVCDQRFKRNFTLASHFRRFHGETVANKTGTRREETPSDSGYEDEEDEAGVVRKRVASPVPSTSSSCGSGDSAIKGNRDKEILELGGGTHNKIKRGKEPAAVDKSVLNRKRKRSGDLDGDLPLHICALCSKVARRRFSLQKHHEHEHGIRTVFRPEETPEGEEFCPECQNLFGSVQCVKGAYIPCGHVSCLVCMRNDMDFGCGQCTTETVTLKQNKTEQESKGSLVLSS